MKKALAITTFLLASQTTSVHPNLFGFREIDEHLRHMRKSMKKMQKASYALVQTSKKALAPHIKQLDDHLLISIDNVATQQVEAISQEDKNTIHIKTDTAIIDIKLDGKYLSLAISEHIEKQTTEQGHTSHSAAFSSCASGLTLQHSINLCEVQVDYNTSTQQLSIMLPYMMEKKGKTIPVNIKK